MRSAAISLALLCLFASSAPAQETRAPEHKITQSESYIMIDPIYSTIADSDRPIGMLLVGFGLDIPDPALRAEVDRAMPILRDAYVRSLMAFAWSHVRPWVQPDADEIADRLQRVTDRTLRKKGARVLLAQLLLRFTR
jgi:flagellar basal body-associated protein FliL